MFGVNTNFKNLLSFEEAVDRHKMVLEAVQSITATTKHARQPSNYIQTLDNKAQKLIVDYAQDTWNECMGAGDPDSVIAGAVRIVMPLDYVPLLRMRSGIPAAYFLVQLIEIVIDTAKMVNDITNDQVLNKCVRDAFDKFEHIRINAQSMQEGFGFDRSAAWVQMVGVADKSGRVAPLMKKIADLAGRMFKAFRYNQIPNKTNDPQEVDGVETGGNIERMLDDEVASMGIDPEVLVRVADERAYQYRMTWESPKSRGPLLIALDESGSMHEERMVWSKACAVALARVALSEGRNVRVVHYATATDVHDVRNKNHEDMLLLTKSHMSGGTCIETALEVSVDQVCKMHSEGDEGADIVFITDGEDRYPDDSFKVMKDKGIQLWTVAIQVDIKAAAEASLTSRGFGRGMSPHLYTYATAYVYIDDKMIRDSGTGAVDAAVQLKKSALGNARSHHV